MACERDQHFMRLAIRLGARGLGRVWPNPAVGCVLVRGGRVLARGWTQPGGRPHAEAIALAKCDARGATAYVSLEPCAHHGLTPPCAQTLINSGVVRVVTALTDPDPRVSGRGHAMLRAAGVEVVENVEAEAARALNAGFLMRLSQGRPWVTLKLALTLDGRIATHTGESRWITCPEARRMVHVLRARHDAVLVGAGTARADDPDLRVRDLGTTHHPVRIVAAPRLDIPVDGRLGRTAQEVPVWLLHGATADQDARKRWSGAGAELLECAATPDGLVPDAMLQTLGQRGITRVFCEGGGHLAASLMQAGLVDDLIVFSAGKMIGSEGRAGLAQLGVTRLAEAPHFKLTDLRQVGADIVHTWTRQTV